MQCSCICASMIMSVSCVFVRRYYKQHVVALVVWKEKTRTGYLKITARSLLQLFAVV